MKNLQGKPTLITGGAGFIGANLAHRLLQTGQKVILYDNLSRPGVERNLRWLLESHGKRVQAVVGDVCDSASLRKVVEQAGQVFHFAAQVAVTTSLDDPVGDFRINAGGTLNLLEELRRLPEPPPLVYTSTNKVYGGWKICRSSLPATDTCPKMRTLWPSGSTKIGRSTSTRRTVAQRGRPISM